MALTETRSAGGANPNTDQTLNSEAPKPKAPKRAKSRRRKPKAAKPKSQKPKAKKRKAAKLAAKEPRCFHVYRVSYLHNGSESSILVLGEVPAHAAAHLRSYLEPAVVTSVSEVAQDVQIPTSLPASPKPKLIKAEKPPKAAPKSKKKAKSKDVE
jgi:hypothetical protein